MLLRTQSSAPAPRTSSSASSYSLRLSHHSTDRRLVLVGQSDPGVRNHLHCPIVPELGHVHVLVALDGQHELQMLYAVLRDREDHVSVAELLSCHATETRRLVAHVKYVGSVLPDRKTDARRYDPNVP